MRNEEFAHYVSTCQDDFNSGKDSRIKKQWWGEIIPVTQFKEKKAFVWKNSLKKLSVALAEVSVCGNG